MPFSPQRSGTNQLIDQLPTKTARLLTAECSLIDLAFSQELCEIGSSVSRVLFPTTVIISLTSQVKGHKPLEVCMIGHEGMLGASLAQGVEYHPMRAVVQSAGQALELSAGAILKQISASVDVRILLNQYLFVCAQQLAQAAACNAFHDLPTRLARWLLMADDRAGIGNPRLTHQFLSEQLGVRRSAVSLAAGFLQDHEIIRYTRGHIELLSRPGLESAACQCYSSNLGYYQRQFPRTRNE